MKIEAICQSLQPILGDRIVRLWQAYLSGDRQEKEEIEQVIRLLYEKTFGSTFVEPILLQPPPRHLALGAFSLANAVYGDKDLGPFGLNSADFLRHVLICGASGSGKTNLAFRILQAFSHHKISFLVFDWKRNFRDLIATSWGKNIRIYTPGQPLSHFLFNPLIPPANLSTQIWQKKLIEIIAHATFLGDGAMSLLQHAFDKAFQKIARPTLKDVEKMLHTMSVSGRSDGWMQSACRALAALNYGETGAMFNTSSNTDLKDLLQHPVVLELDALTQTDKVFLVETFLLWLHHYRLSNPTGRREHFEHAILIEEAHHIFNGKKSDLSGGESIVDTMIREIRELGEGVIVIDQSPSLLSVPVRANTGTTFALSLKDAQDVDAAARALLLDRDERTLLGKLPIGQAVVRCMGRYPTPFVVDIPKLDMVKGSVSDSWIREHMRPYSRHTSAEETYSGVQNGISVQKQGRKRELSDKEKELLKDIKNHSADGVVARYKRLGWSRRKGNSAKEGLLKKGLVYDEAVPTRSGRVVVLRLTKVGKEVVGQAKVERQGGGAHEYWKYHFKKQFEAKGYRIRVEAPIGKSKNIDLVATNDDVSFAIEIETGKSDCVANVRKCIAAKFEKILVIATDERAQREVMRQLDGAGLLQDARVKVLCARADTSLGS